MSRNSKSKVTTSTSTSRRPKPSGVLRDKAYFDALIQRGERDFASADARAWQAAFGEEEDAPASSTSPADQPDPE